jgi:glycosyltransferase involved in cell wall biosynthesis
MTEHTPDQTIETFAYSGVKTSAHEQKERPLITFSLIAYNQEQFIRAAVEGAFSQTYSPLEIILSDDCSKDHTFDIMKQMTDAYKGPHKIILNRNEKNLGMGRHFSKTMKLATGEIIELADGDDISLPERTMETWKIMRDNADIMSVSLGLYRFTGNPPVEILSNGEERLRKYDISNYISDIGFHLNAPARAFRKFTHDFFGPLDENCPVEDGPNLMRCLLHGKVASYSKTAVLYRIHGANYYASDNKYLIDFKSIFANYIKDIEKAEKSNLIDGDTAKRCLRATRQRENRELIKIRFHKSNIKLINFFFYIFFSRLFSRKAKLGFFKQALQSNMIELIKSIIVAAMKFSKLSNIRRWKNPDSLNKSWDARTIMIAKLIPPGTSIIEFGAGRMILKEYIPKTCSYTPSDIVSRGEGTIVIDLNSKPYPILNQHFDIAVFSGVLEYIYDIRELIVYLSSFVDSLIVSYAIADECDSLVHRRKQGWVNDYKYKDIVALIEASGFICRNVETWKQQKIFIFQRAGAKKMAHPR